MQLNEIGTDDPTKSRLAVCHARQSKLYTLMQQEYG